MRVSCVMPTYRRPALLRRALEAVERLDPAPAEVVVVVRDTDAETLVVLEEFPFVRVATVTAPGVLAAMRRGVAETTGEVIAFLDDDAVPPGDWLGAILRQLDDPGVGGACGRDVVTVADDEPLREDVGRITRWGKLVGNHHLATGAARDVDVLKGAAMVMRREALALPERLRGSGAEVHWEVATCLHASASGWRLRVDPSCRVSHLPGPRFDADRRDRPAPSATFDAAYNLVLCMLTFRPELSARRALFGVVVGDAATPGLARGLVALARGEAGIAGRTLPSLAGQLGGLAAVAAGRRVTMEPGIEFAAAWSDVADVDGWMTKQQAAMLFRAARSVRPGDSIVEIGSHHGRSTIIIARAAADGVPVVAVDPFDDPRWGGGAENYDTFHRNLARAGIGDRVRAVRALSEQALRDWDGGSVGMVYIDGAHDRATALADLRGWADRLVPGGTLLVHDAFSSTGVTAAVLQQFLGRPRFAFVGVAGSLLALRKEGRTTSSPVLTVHLLGRLPYFVRNLAVKVALRRGWSGVSRLLGHHGSNPPF